MNHFLFDLMQSAVDIVGTSPHPTSKIAATLAGRDTTLSRVNIWPPPIAAHFDMGVRIGNSSGTIHAETACILESAITEGASIFLTDPPCPNCAKNMAEAGVRELYIDHKGFDKEWAARRGDQFDHMSMQILQRAGIRVYEIRRKEQKITPINDIEQNYIPPEENRMTMETISGEIDFKKMIKSARGVYESRPFALAIARDGKKIVRMEATAHLVTGFTSRNMNEKPEDKYSFIMEPINRLLMGAARRGLKIDTDYIYSSRVPTSRELVNLIGAGLTKLRIGDHGDSRDEFGPQALAQLTDAGILTIE